MWVQMENKYRHFLNAYAHLHILNICIIYNGPLSNAKLSYLLHYSVII